MPLIHRCPKCNARFNPPRPEVSECPQCGIWFHKWGREAHVERASDPEGISPEKDPEGIDPASFYGRLLALVFLAAWGFQLVAMDYRTGELGHSFMHNILLPIHEAGHVLFMPFGEFLTILGGSLFQLALPMGIGAAFFFRQNDAFGAAVCLWWTGVSLLDLAPYIYDALQPQLILLGGHTGEDGPHDWIYLLGRLGAIPQAHGWGTAAHHLGMITLLAGLAWGGATLWRVRPEA
jgi:hypothetical protein